MLCSYGDISNSVKTIGEIRARVGIPASNNYGLGTITDKNEAIKACLRERQVELAMRVSVIGIYGVGCCIMMMQVITILPVLPWVLSR